MRPGSGRGVPPVSVLVVEDDRAIREILCEILQDEGYTVATACNGAEALQLLKRLRPDLIVLDLNMPVMNGGDFRLVQRLDPAFRNIPTVVLSAVDRLQEHAAEIEAVLCLAKPVKLRELLAAVERFCGPRGDADVNPSA
jgi:CheY-like chemotaxis protein